MKILVIQLTRLGDILCTLPTLSALKRENPEAEIHFLVRKRFAGAARLAQVDHLWQFDTQSILGGLVTEADDISKALLKLNQFIEPLRQEKFDRIINLSFSPSSSFISHMIGRGQVATSGYTRTSDLFLLVPDKASQYFRAQVGIEKSNRLHVIDLMGWIANVRIKRSDLFEESVEKRGGVVCHLGASHKDKTWPEVSWVGLLSKLSKEQDDQITLIGGPEEVELAESILLQVGKEKITNLVGETSWPEMIDLLRRAKLFIGADSGPLHGASLAGCVTLNLSVGQVRFWETGPITPGSRILVSQEPQGLMSDFVSGHAMDMLAQTKTMSGAYVCRQSGGVRYEAIGITRLDSSLQDAWSMVEWMYFEGEQPQMRGDLPAICAQAEEAADLALQQLDVLEKNPEKVEVVGILDRLDEVIDLFGQNIKPLSPLIDFFKTQKENIPPGERNEIFTQTRQCYSVLKESLLALQPHERA